MNDTPDEIIDRLVLYMLQVADTEQTDQQRIDQRDGMVTGLCMAIAIASGVPGPLDGHELAMIGKDIAQSAADRLSEQHQQ